MVSLVSKKGKEGHDLSLSLSLNGFKPSRTLCHMHSKGKCCFSSSEPWKEEKSVQRKIWLFPWLMFLLFCLSSFSSLKVWKSRIKSCSVVYALFASFEQYQDEAVRQSIKVRLKVVRGLGFSLPNNMFTLKFVLTEPLNALCPLKCLILHKMIENDLNIWINVMLLLLQGLNIHSCCMFGILNFHVPPLKSWCSND